ncbi:MAG: HAMP domain-containing sensor histidine kinase [Candidatus Competibacteraceae bacterium]|nr:HAMP domain-containing sensor histidine kinase [Candidatus Competibacteraceae bacterium]
MKPKETLKRRIGRTFLLQAAAISVAAVVSVLLAAAVIKQVLVTEALRMEAAYFWERRAADPAFPLPDTRNLSGFLAPADNDRALPENLRGRSDGFHSVPGQAGLTTVYITTQNNRRLYLLFDSERVNELAAYFGLAPLVVVLLVLYLSVWLAFRASQRAISPVIWLAREVNRLDPQAPVVQRFDPSRLPPDADEEVRVLAAALTGLADRLEAFVERERTFTRDASHELRTPLTVLRVATDLLLDRADLPADARASIIRIRRSSDEMEELVNAFLLLARETDQGLPSTLVCINDVVAAELENLRPLVARKPVEIRVDAECRLLVAGPEPALSAVIRNLLRNALCYTDAGHVNINIAPRRLRIEDSGIGMAPQQLKEAFRPYFRGEPQRRGGYGVGLTIVRRFADRFGWSVAIQSEPGIGTQVEVGFPDAQCHPEPTA